MSWNHRILKHVSEQDISYGVHEVYYDDAGNPNAWTEREVGPHGESEREMRQSWMLYRSAFWKPVLVVKDGKVIDTEHRLYPTPNKKEPTP